MSETSTIFISVLGGLFTSGCLTTLLTTWFNHRLKNSIEHEYNTKLTAFKADKEKEISAFKTELEHKNAIVLVEFKTELERAATERNFRFSHVFEKTAEVIAEVHKRLLAIHNATLQCIRNLANKDEQQVYALIANVEQVHADFDAYFVHHRLYVPKESCQRIDAFSEKLRRVLGKFYAVRTLPKSEAEASPNSVMRLELFNDFLDEVPKLLAPVEDDFQRLLGFPTEGEAAKRGQRQS